MEELNMEEDEEEDDYDYEFANLSPEEITGNVFDPSRYPTMECEVTNIIGCRIACSAQKNQLTDFEPECVTYIYEGLMEIMRSILVSLSHEQRLIQHGRNFSFKKLLDVGKPMIPRVRRSPSWRDVITVAYFESFMKKNRYLIQYEKIYRKFMLRVQHALKKRVR